jgi:DNA-binding transcriptional regulator YiaG
VPTLYARATRRAAEICGEDVLAERLGVTGKQLRYWIQGLADPPAAAFLQVADILGEKTLEELVDPPRKK